MLTRPALTECGFDLVCVAALRLGMRTGYHLSEKSDLLAIECHLGETRG